ncbi:hypothetical protein V8G54_000169 (mitochondrion) [Vigna mungo]|uniref:Reverse transcriptase Ty1/copia-type domain-containing protein n=1 Tax=Vigna mungo TaxID=3915 RepID=A0AAQ3MLY2_VIGMU
MECGLEIRKNIEEELESEPEHIVKSETSEVMIRRSSRIIGDEYVKWKLAMKDETKSLQKNKTWSLAKLPEGKKVPIQNMWVYRLKEESDNNRRYKGRLVVKGFQQK